LKLHRLLLVSSALSYVNNYRLLLGICHTDDKNETRRQKAHSRRHKLNRMLAINPARSLQNTGRLRQNRSHSVVKYLLS